MTTMLFILTAVLVVYIIYMMVSSSGTAVSYSPAEKTANKPKPSTRKASSTAKKATKPIKPKPSASTKPTPSSDEEPKYLTAGFKDPKTGEKAANPTNYRFAKRWIKEALVAEGVLDKIYKNSELDDSKTNKRVKEALDQFKQMEKYYA